MPALSHWDEFLLWVSAAPQLGCVDGTGQDCLKNLVLAMAGFWLS